MFHIFAAYRLAAGGKDMEPYDEKVCRYSLNRIFGYTPKTAYALIGHFGSASGIFSAGCRMLKEALPYTNGIDRINDAEYACAEKELASMEARGFSFICSSGEYYPSSLRECEDAPLGLYLRSGSPPESIFHSRTFIAVIGTRDLTPYGKDWCRRIISYLAATEVQPTVVSGLAIGTDITAHRAALEYGLPTIAVIPTGIDGIYPLRHSMDADRIASSPGSAIITDFPPGTAAIKLNFLRRNRIIAGLCKATVLIESKIKGGGMMTARLAFSYNRDVLALPGRIDDLRSQGCNLLIREKIAEPIISGHSMAETIGLRNIHGDRVKTDGEEKIRRMYSGRMDSSTIDLMAMILLKIKKQSGISIGEIAEECRIEYRRAAELTGLLEYDGLISTDLMRRCTINI
ncbi:MAG: DNA-protecting protein DprA [Clostridium sp.]|nr:DNA-protecting protein DprA [Bacteroides sp.]MCM1198861.1 DNA-protecting protein DprA [Clostridium sp.]